MGVSGYRLPPYKGGHSLKSFYDTLWFYEDGLIKLRFKETSLEENSILFTITNCFLYNTIKHELVHDSVMSNGQIVGMRSFDNMTAIITYLCKYDYRKYFIIKIWPQYWHTRDFIYIGYVQNRWWAYPLLPLLYLMFLIMALTTYKVRPAPWDWVLQGFPPRTKIRKTDTEILYWIRLQLPKRYKFIHWTAKTIVPLLKRKFGKDYLYGMMQLYYRDPEHPNRNYKDK